MKRTAPVLAALVLLTLSSGGLAASKPQVHIPEGFVDLTGGVPAALAGKVPPTSEQMAQSGHVACAIDIDHPDPTDGFLANVIADEHEGRMVDLSRSSSVSDDFVQVLAKAYPAGTTFNVVSVNSVSVGGFRGMRILVDAQLATGGLKQLLYILPAGEETLTLAYTAPRDSYATYEPRFDASALATTGLTNPPNDFLSMIPTITVGAGVGVFATLMAARKKKKAEAGTPE